MARLSPLGFKYVDMLGRYAFTLSDLVARGELRPLRDPDDWAWTSYNDRCAPFLFHCSPDPGYAYDG